MKRVILPILLILIIVPGKTLMAAPEQGRHLAGGQTSGSFSSEGGALIYSPLGSGQNAMTAPAPTIHQTAGRQAANTFASSLFSQALLTLCGVLYAFFLSAISARAMRNSTSLLRRKPLPMFFRGGVVILLLRFALGIGLHMLHTPLRLLMLPLVAANGLALLALLGYGWVCSMAMLGGKNRSGANAPEKWFSAALKGLAGFFVLNLFLSLIGLAWFGTALELFFALAGTGAALAGRFGMRMPA